MIEKVKIKSIDSERIEKDDSFPNAYAFYIELDTAPHAVWEELFLRRYESDWFNLKREMTIQGKEIRVVTAPGEEEHQVDFYRRLVEETNRDAEEYNRDLAQQSELASRVAQSESAEAQRIRENLKKIHI
ncbi:MAG: hypothetical protein DMG22_07715 [Acidobacteria bacterium]|nr:MAG: hypothetical protein DMG22_07715 [Acidobacteriota bacterium]